MKFWACTAALLLALPAVALADGPLPLEIERTERNAIGKNPRIRIYLRPGAKSEVYLQRIHGQKNCEHWLEDLQGELAARVDKVVLEVESLREALNKGDRELKSKKTNFLGGRDLYLVRWDENAEGVGSDKVWAFTNPPYSLKWAIDALYREAVDQAPADDEDQVSFGEGLPLPQVGEPASSEPPPAITEFSFTWFARSNPSDPFSEQQFKVEFRGEASSFGQGQPLSEIPPEAVRGLRSAMETAAAHGALRDSFSAPADGPEYYALEVRYGQETKRFAAGRMADAPPPALRPVFKILADLLQPLLAQGSAPSQQGLMNSLQALQQDK